MSLVALDQYTPSQQLAAGNALDMMDRLDDRLGDRLGDHYSKQRKHLRRDFRGLATLYVPNSLNLDLDSVPTNSCTVWARSVSESGLSFIYPGRMPSKQVVIGLDLSNGSQTLFRASIVRTRQVPGTDFWEYGVTFTGRASS